MSDTKTITKSLAGVEDLLQGVDTVEQNRAGTVVTVHRTHQFVPVSNENLLANLDPTKFGLGVVVKENLVTYYKYTTDPGAKGISSNVDSGVWERLNSGNTEAPVFNRLMSFTLGNTLQYSEDALFNEADNKYYTWSGVLPKVVPSGSTPASTGGIGPGAWIDVGDASFRQLIRAVPDIRTLMAKVWDGIVVNVLGYVPGTYFGGGEFYWDATQARTNHNGITIFSPTVPWDGTYTNLAAFLAGTGEANPSGLGCWMRVQSSRDMLVSWGGVDISGTVATDLAVTAVIKYANVVKRSVRFDSGAIIKCGFTTLVQHYDKFNLNIQCSFVLENISGIKVYAENDVEFNTDHPTYPERVVFRLKNCDESVFSGFNFNSGFTDYSTSVSDTTFKPQEWWKGFTAEGCSSLEIKDHWVNACHVFVMADNTNLAANLQNVDVHVTGCRFKYVVNYCIITRSINLVEFSRNKVSHQGRKWHTYGEAVAPTTQTKNFIVCDNEFTDQIAQQSCITPGPHVESGLIANNYCRRNFGIFIENGSSSNIVIEGNTSISTGERADTTHILLVGEADDNPVGASPHSNILISNNMFKGGGFAVQEYNTGIPLRTGFDIIGNHMIDCKLPIITNQSFIGIKVINNYMVAPTDFPDLTIAGQRPEIRGNTLVGVRVRARDIGYTIISPKITDNIFATNSIGSSFPALVDYTDFSGLVAKGNDLTSATYTSFMVTAPNCNNAGFKYLGQTEGLLDNPATVYGAKLTNAVLGDIVHNREPSASVMTFAWVCTDGAAKTFSKINLV